MVVNNALTLTLFAWASFCRISSSSGVIRTVLRSDFLVFAFKTLTPNCTTMLHTLSFAISSWTSSLNPALDNGWMVKSLKWREFEKSNPQPVYSALREICEEIHSQGGFFCNYCYQREGWYCFPCDKVRKILEKRNETSAVKLLSPSDKESHLAFLRGGVRFWK